MLSPLAAADLLMTADGHPPHLDILRRLRTPGR